MISYDGLYVELEKKGLKKTDLIKGLGISSRTIAKIGKGEKLSTATMEKIAGYLGCEKYLLAREISSSFIRLFTSLHHSLNAGL